MVSIWFLVQHIFSTIAMFAASLATERKGGQRFTSTAFTWSGEGGIRTRGTGLPRTPV